MCPSKIPRSGPGFLPSPETGLKRPKDPSLPTVPSRKRTVFVRNSSAEVERNLRRGRRVAHHVTRKGASCDNL